MVIVGVVVVVVVAVVVELEIEEMGVFVASIMKKRGDKEDPND